MAPSSRSRSGKAGRAGSVGRLTRALARQRTDARSQAEHWLDLKSELDDTLDRYVALFADAPIAYLTLDTAGSIVRMNGAAMRLLGCEADHPAPKPFVALLAGGEARAFHIHLHQCRRTGEASVELRIARERRSVRLISRRTLDGPQTTVFFTVVLDITDERRQQEALRESEARYREIVETASEGICIVNARNEIAFANRRLEVMLRMPAGALVGRRAVEIVDERDVAEAEAAFRLLDIGVNGQNDLRLRRSDGTILPTSLSTTILRDSGGRFVGMLQMYTDATARQELIATREMLVRQLVAAQERERQRIARELHDQVGQHVVALSLGLARLRGPGPRSEDDAAVIDQLRQVAEALGRDMHTLALELRPSALDHLGLAPALRGYAEDVSARTGLQFDVHCRGADELVIDPAIQTGVYRIAQEAVTNVVKHAEAHAISLILETHGHELQLIVEDDGRGFDVRQAAAGDGMLGLAGMRERAALLGGTVTIESSPGRGATVYARIPLAATAPEKATQHHD